MPITLVKSLIEWPLFRILVRQRWGDGGTNQEQSAGGWEILPAEGTGPGKIGYHLLYFDRCALPFNGTCRFGARYGKIDKGIVGVSPETLTSLIAGGAWDSDTSTLRVRDLTGYEVRVQAAHADQDVTDWRTVWWGSVDYQADTGWPAADVPAGERTYHCIDGLARTKTWRIDRHGYTAQNYDSSAATRYTNVRGPLGYNVGRGAISQETRVAGNKDGTSSLTWTTDAGLAVSFHTTPGSAASTYWSDREAVNHALAVSKPPREPLFTIAGFTDLLSQNVSPWDVEEGTTAWDFLNRVCRRERGRGLAFCDWNDDSGDPTGPLTCKITINPQLVAPITYPHPVTGATVTLPGALASGTTVIVDLINDQRVMQGDFSLGDQYKTRFGYLESQGERIEVLVTAGFADNGSGTGQQTEGVALVRGWSNTEQTTFRGLTGANLDKRREARYNQVYQYYRFRPDWRGYVGNGAGTGGPLTRADYRCDDTGSISVPSFYELPTMSGDDIEVLHDLPLYEGYDYAGTAPVKFGAGDEALDPPRRKILTLLKKTGDKFILLEQDTRVSATMHLDKNGFWIVHSDDDGGTTRRLSDTSYTGDDGYSAAVNYYDLALTIGIRLPNRVRFASGDPSSRKKGLITHRDHHLWLAHPLAIYDLNCASGDTSAGFAPKRAAGFTTPGLLRDDRAALAQLHQLAWAWYGTTFTRRSATWSIRDFGFFETFSAVEGTTTNPGAGTATDMDYPQLGDVVTDLFANGQDHQINTPVTRVAYDNERGVTTWSTEWAELDFAR